MKNYPSQRTDEYFIYSFLCNNRANLRISGIAQLLQESAWLHAESCNAGYQSLIKEGLIWVLSALKIKIYETPSWGESLKLNTWGRGYENLFAYRDFEIFDSVTNNIRIHASSAWLLVDSVNHRPKRITPDLQRITALNKSWDTVNPGKFRSPESYEYQRNLRVLHSDIDVYDHVNNTRYIQWCVDSVADFHKGKEDLNEFDIRFISEAHLNDDVNLQYQKEDGYYYFSGLNEVTGKDIFRARAKIADGKLT